MSEYQVGELIGGHYEVHQALLGGMGEVYLCVEQETHEPYALKTFQRRYLNHPHLYQAFEREVTTWIALQNHPNIVRCFAMNVFREQPFMILEWVASDDSCGLNLRDWLQYGPLDVQHAFVFTLDICRGLLHAQKKQPGIVHCDLKPDNILIDHDRVAKITDFGLAQIVKDAEVAVAGGERRPGQLQHVPGAPRIVGTPLYMSPEQWRGERLDVRADIYAVGCLLYEMITGEPPFQAATLMTLRKRHLDTPIPVVAERYHVPRQVDLILARCLAKNPRDRFATVGDLLAQVLAVHDQHFVETFRMPSAAPDFTAIDFNNRGSTYARLHRYDDALSDFTRAIALQPTYAIAYANRARVYEQMHRYGEACADYSSAIHDDPTDAMLYRARGRAHHALHQLDLAVADYARALALDPANVSISAEIERMESAGVLS